VGQKRHDFLQMKRRIGAMSLVVAVAMLLAWPAGAIAQTSTAGCPTAVGPVWVVDVRHVPSCQPFSVDNPSVRYEYQTADGCWQAADWHHFQSSLDDCMPTVVFVHGNDTSASLAKREGLELIRVIQKKQPHLPVRLVIWSWPSDRAQTGPLRDIRAKAVMADHQATRLAGWLESIGTSMPVGLVGYSFGARAVNGAMRHLANDPRTASGAPIRVALVAAAMDPDALYGRSGWRLPRLDSIVITRNRDDSALRWYPLLNRHTGTQALGTVGVRSRPLGTNPLSVIDVTRTVGRQHNWFGYLRSPALQQRLALFAFPNHRCDLVNAATEADGARTVGTSAAQDPTPSTAAADRRLD